MIFTLLPPRPFRNSNSVTPCSSAASSSATLVSGRTLLIDDFKAVSCIGQGSYGTVYEVEDRVTAASLAMKVVPKVLVDPEDISAERQTLQELAERRNPWLLSLRGSFHDSDNYYILTDYYAAGDIINQFEMTGSPTHDQVRLIIAELIVAVESLHREKIVHRDIKPGNILVDDAGHIVLSDLGLARDFKVDLRSRTPDALASAFLTQCRCGSPGYMSPEMWKGEPYSFEADCWAIGIVMFQLLTCRLPFRLDTGTDMDELCTSVCEDPLLFRRYDGTDAVEKDFLFKALKKSPGARLSLDSMKAHRYFDGVDFEQVARKECPPPFEPEFGEPSPDLISPCIVSGIPFKDSQEPWFNFVDLSLQSPAPVELAPGGPPVLAQPACTEKPRTSGFRARCRKFLNVSFDSILRVAPIRLLRKRWSPRGQPCVPRGHKESRTRWYEMCEA